MACIYILNSRGGIWSFNFDITYFYPIIVTPYYKVNPAMEFHRLAAEQSMSVEGMGSTQLKKSIR